MKMVVGLLCACLLSVAADAATIADTLGAEFAFNRGQGWQKYQLGTKVIEDKVADLKVTYDFSKQGAGLADHWLIRAANGGMMAATKGTLPKNAILTGCYIDIITAVTGAGANFSLGTGLSSTDLLPSTVASTFASGIKACTPTGTAATSIKITSDSIPIINLSSAALTAGKFNVHLLYELSD